MAVTVTLTREELDFLLYSMRRGCRVLEKQREGLREKFGDEADCRSVNAKLSLAETIRGKLRGCGND